MILKLKKPTPVTFFTAFLLVYALANGGWGYIIKGNVWNAVVALTGIYFFMAFLASKPKIDFYAFLLIAMAGIILFNNDYLYVDRSYVIRSITAISFSLAAHNRNGWLRESVIPLLTILGLFYSVMTVFSYYVPGFYSGVIFPFFSAFGSSTRFLVVQTNAAGFTFHYSTNGMMCAMAVCCMCGYLVPKSGKTKLRTRAVVLFFLFIAWFALLLTTKRAHILFCAAGAVVAYYAYNSNKPVSRLFKIAVLCLTVFIVFTILAAVFPQVTGFLTRFSEESSSGDVTNGRTELWLPALELFKARPIFGNGWYYFYHNVKLMNDSAHVHNVYIQLLAETGIVGFIIFVSFFAVSFYRTFVCVAASRKKFIELEPWQLRILIISLCYQTFFLLYCITGTCLYEVNTLFAYFFFCTVGNYLWEKNVKNIDIHRRK